MMRKTTITDSMDLISCIDEKLKKELTDDCFNGNNGLDFIIFASSLIKCVINIRESTFSAVIDLGNREYVDGCDGHPFTSNIYSDDIRSCLIRIREYCRSRLLKKFLMAKGWMDEKSKPVKQRNNDDWERKHHSFLNWKYDHRNNTGPVKEWAERYVDAMKSYFGNRVSDIEITDITQTRPQDSGFDFKFRMYDYFDMEGGAGTGLGWFINKGDYFIELPTTQEWFDMADLEIFFQEMQEELELRLPDEYLESKGWK